MTTRVKNMRVDSFLCYAIRVRRSKYEGLRELPGNGVIRSIGWAKKNFRRGRIMV